MGRTKWPWWPGVVVCLLAPTAASAGDGALEGRVLRVQEGEVVLDLAGGRGVPSNAILQVYRRLVVKHPITGKDLEDRFPIGQVPVAEVGELLAIVRDTSGLSRPPAAGDYVVYEPNARQPAAPPIETEPVDADPETIAVEYTLKSNMGQPLADQIRRWEQVLQAFPDGTYAENIGRELTQLRALLDQAREAQAAPPTPREPGRLTTRHLAPAHIPKGQPAALAIAVVEPEYVHDARLLVRRAGHRAWDALPLQRDGDYYFRGQLPGKYTAEPGAVEYFVELVRTNAALEAAAGSAKKPLRVDVTPPPPGAEGPGSSQAVVESRYVDFNTSGAAPDHYFQVEGAFTYGVDWWILRTIRVGVGMINGEGGPTELIDAGGATRTISLNYAFAEAEIGVGPWVGLATRISGGNHHTTADGTSTAVAGFEGRARFGRFDGTRLVIGGAFVEDVGSKIFTDMHVEVFERVPLKGSAVVTDLPVAADWGLRLSGQAGYRVTDWLTVNAEAGWNARTIHHHGFTAGGGLALNW